MNCGGDGKYNNHVMDKLRGRRATHYHEVHMAQDGIRMGGTYKTRKQCASNRFWWSSAIVGCDYVCPWFENMSLEVKS